LLQRFVREIRLLRKCCRIVDAPQPWAGNRDKAADMLDLVRFEASQSLESQFL
jgi:hypothetical protein